jgi:Flp pilus assembly pilin Flp
MDASKDASRRASRRAVHDDRRGPSAVEYCLTAALISIVIIAALSALGASIQSQLGALAAAIAAPAP